MSAGNLKRDFFEQERLVLLKSLLMLSHGQVGKKPHTMSEIAYLRFVKPFIYPKFCRFVMEHI